DVGSYSKPALADVDGDGDLDLVVGKDSGTLWYFKKIGRATGTGYVNQTGSAKPFEGFDGRSNAGPALADVDGDGDLDLVVGKDTGTLWYFKNTGTAGSPAYANQTGSANPFDGFDVGSNSTPALADLDLDGDLDLVVGKDTGTLWYFK